MFRNQPRLLKNLCRTPSLFTKRTMSKEGVSASVFDVEPKNTLFAKMIRGDIKVEPVYEDDDVYER